MRKIIYGICALVIIFAVLYIIMLGGDKPVQLVESTPEPTPESTMETVISTPSAFEESYLKLIEELYEQEGWEIGTLKKVEMNKVIKTDYLDFQVTGAEKVETYDGYEAAFEDYEYYVVDVTVKNTFKEAIPVGTYDFVIFYEVDDELVEDYPYSDTGNGEMYPDDITLDSDASVSGKLVFDIPNGAKLVSVAYVEVHLTESGGTRMGTMYVVPIE